MPVQSNQGRGAATSPKLTPSATSATSKRPVQSKMVDWYDPIQLVQTGIRVIVSTTLGRNTDYRMLEAVAHRGDRTPFFDHTCVYEWRDEEYSVDGDKPRE